ncbi:MAG TPA: SDR family oxidoreductase [Aliidongia sp.]|nr:SDR family oxidoreductase [Aliidongia sp.]
MANSQGIAVITGASAGIGAVYAERLAARGYDLLLVARRLDRLTDLQARLAHDHGAVIGTMAADLENPADLAKLEDRIAAEDIAFLVNNAGAGGLGKTADATAEQLERIVRLNITALTRLSHAALASFRGRESGALVNIGSMMAHSPSPAGAVYSGSKAYVMNFTRSLQLEYRDQPIRIQLVMPGPIRTEFFSSQGMNESVFPAESYLSAEQLVDATFAGLDAGEPVTVPSMLDLQPWNDLEAARTEFVTSVMSGQVAPRYRS